MASENRGTRRIDPKFSQRAAVVLSSGFWFAEPPYDLPRAEFGKWFEERHQLKEQLFQAIDRASRYEDLQGRDRTLFNEAERYNEQYNARVGQRR